MGIALRDSRLEEEMKAAAGRAEELDLEGRNAQIRDLAVAELRDERAAFTPLIDVEDNREVERDRKIHEVGSKRKAANLHFASLHASLNAGVRMAAASGQQPDSTMREVQSYVAGITAAGFTELPRKDALAHLKRSLGYADQFVPAALQAEVIAPARAAYDAFAAAREELSSSEGQWNQAQADLVEARDRAAAGYSAFRDTMSGVLRKVGRQGRLNQIVQPISVVFYGQQGGGPQDPVEPVEPVEPVVDEA